MQLQVNDKDQHQHSPDRGPGPGPLDVKDNGILPVSVQSDQTPIPLLSVVPAFATTQETWLDAKYQVSQREHDDSRHT